MSERLDANREAEIRQRAAFAAECAVEGVGGPLDTIERERAQLLSELDAVRAERDTLAAALAEVTRTIAAGRDAVAAAAAAWEAGGDHETVLDAAEANMTDLNRVLAAALPADLAAERFRRERAEALETAADAIERGSVLSQYGAHGWLRARAADERGGK